MEEIYRRLRQFGVVPVIAIESESSALSLADALIEGGLPVAEITFRTSAAAKVIETLRKKKPEMTIGAGTVLSEENVRVAHDSGAMFEVAPGLNPALVTMALDLGMPFAPGIQTPTEIEQAMSLGCKALKFFPAEACGGVKILKAVSAPYKHTGVQFLPTGGVNIGNLGDYLGMDVVLCVGGTWVAKKEDIADGKWQEITKRCREISKVVGTFR